MATITCTGAQIGTDLTIGSRIRNLAAGGSSVGTEEPESSMNVSAELDWQEEELTTARQIDGLIRYNFTFTVFGTITEAKLPLRQIFSRHSAAAAAIRYHAHHYGDTR